VPVKSENEMKIGIMVDGSFTELTPIPEYRNDEDKTCYAASLDEDLFCKNANNKEIVGTFDDSMLLFKNHEQTMSVSITHNRSYRRFIRSIRIVFPTPSNKSNNWLRMHGYPMTRKVI
jgi:hypothetical protein